MPKYHVKIAAKEKDTLVIHAHSKSEARRKAAARIEQDYGPDWSIDEILICKEGQ